MQHGSLLGIGTCLEAYALKKNRDGINFDKNDLVKECLNRIGEFKYTAYQTTYVHLIYSRFMIFFCAL